MSVKTYDPKKVALIIGGKRMSGFAEGSFIKVTRNDAAFTLQIGVDGEGTRTKSNNKSGKIEFELMQSSDSNAAMSALAQLDEVANQGVVEAMVKDNSPGGTSVYVAATAWVEKLPDSEFARTAGPRRWVMETDVISVFVGGN